MIASLTTLSRRRAAPVLLAAAAAFAALMPPGAHAERADRDKPLDALVTERAPLAEVAEFIGI